MKILVTLSRVPYPLEKGDKLRAYHQIRYLSQHHDIYLVALYSGKVHPKAAEALSPFCQKIFFLKQSRASQFWNIFLSFFKGLPLQCGYFFSKRNDRKISKIIEEIKPDRIYCQLFRMAEYVKDYTIPKVIDYQDAFSKGLLRRSEKAPCFAKPFFKMEAKRVARYEQEIFDCFEGKTIITTMDRDLIPHPQRDNIVIIPNGVDFQHFSYNNEKKIYDLIFSGNMNYAPNVDAAVYLATEIFPLLKKEFPDLRLVLCGANPAARVKALQNQDVIVTGWVDSMPEWYAQSKIFVAPLRMGTGLQNKLLEAMSMKLPCITSSLAGRPLESAESENAILVCHSTDDYVEAIRKLLTEQNAYQKTAETGYLYVHKHYDWESATEKLMKLF